MGPPRTLKPTEFHELSVDSWPNTALSCFDWTDHWWTCKVQDYKTSKLAGLFNTSNDNSVEIFCERSYDKSPSIYSFYSSWSQKQQKSAKALVIHLICLLTLYLLLVVLGLHTSCYHQKSRISFIGQTYTRNLPSVCCSNCTFTQTNWQEDRIRHRAKNKDNKAEQRQNKQTKKPRTFVYMRWGEKKWKNINKTCLYASQEFLWTVWLGGVAVYACIHPSIYSRYITVAKNCTVCWATLQHLVIKVI